MTVTNAAPIVTARQGLPDSWTLQTYLDNGGYQGLRKALEMRPEEISIPSSSMCGSKASSSRSLQVPGSDSSALTTR